jgi:predicted DNA-binding protein with PD1-like motif/glutaredoxin
MARHLILEVVRQAQGAADRADQQQGDADGSAARSCRQTAWVQLERGFYGQPQRASINPTVAMSRCFVHRRIGIQGGMTGHCLSWRPPSVRVMPSPLPNALLSQPLHLDPGADLRRSLEQLALERGASGFALSVVGNLSQACFQCPGKAAPTVLRGELEIITLSGTLSPQGVHLHLSFSDADCRVWGGHLEPGSLVLKGADLLVGWLAAAAVPPQAPVGADGEQRQAPGAAGSERPRLEIAVLPGCPYSARALRMLRTLAIPHRVENVSSDVQRSQVASRSGASSFPQLFLDGEPIGGYDALAELHGRGGLESLRTS